MKYMHKKFPILVYWQVFLQEYNIAYKNKSTRNKILNKVTYGELNLNS